MPNFPSSDLVKRELGWRIGAWRNSGSGQIIEGSSTQQKRWGHRLVPQRDRTGAPSASFSALARFLYKFVTPGTVTTTIDSDKSCRLRKWALWAMSCEQISIASTSRGFQQILSFDRVSTFLILFLADNGGCAEGGMLGNNSRHPEQRIVSGFTFVVEKIIDLLEGYHPTFHAA